MNSQEFHLAAQTWEYLIGLSGLVLFLLFWKFVNGTPKRKSVN